MNINQEQREKNEARTKGRNMRKEEVQEFIKEFIVVTKGIKINGKPFATSITPKTIGTNPDLTIEEMRRVLDVNDESKVDFLRQIYIRGGQSIINRLFPDENIVNLPTVSFEEVGNAINLSY